MLRPSETLSEWCQGYGAYNFLVGNCHLFWRGGLYWPFSNLGGQFPDPKGRMEKNNVDLDLRKCPVVALQVLVPADSLVVGDLEYSFKMPHLRIQFLPFFKRRRWRYINKHRSKEYHRYRIECTNDWNNWNFYGKIYTFLVRMRKRKCLEEYFWLLAHALSYCLRHRRWTWPIRM